MALRGSRLVPGIVTKTLVCIDSLDDFDYHGRIFNPYMPRPHEFNGIKELLDVLDDFFDNMGYPQPSYAKRSFFPKKRENPGETGLLTENGTYHTIEKYFDDRYFIDYSGTLATFVFLVKFRNSATWQGSAHWIEGLKKYNFKSVLELIRFMDSAIIHGQEQLSGTDPLH